jgi:hypothetical protein
MDVKTIALLAGLLGSILTVLITKVFDIFQKKFEFKSDLKREFFNRKINSLEKASIQYSILTSALGNLSNFFQVIKNKDTYYDVSVYQPILNSIDVQMKKVSEATYDLANALFIYIDVDQEEFWDFQSIEEILQTIGHIGHHQLQMQIWTDLLEKNRDSQKERFIKSKINEIENEFEKSIEKLSEQLKECNKKFFKLQKKIRGELKQYEN